MNPTPNTCTALVPALPTTSVVEAPQPAPVVPVLFHFGGYQFAAFVYPYQLQQPRHPGRPPGWGLYGEAGDVELVGEYSNGQRCPVLWHQVSEYTYHDLPGRPTVPVLAPAPGTWENTNTVGAGPYLYHLVALHVPEGAVGVLVCSRGATAPAPLLHAAGYTYVGPKERPTPAYPPGGRRISELPTWFPELNPPTIPGSALVVAATYQRHRAASMRGAETFAVGACLLLEADPTEERNGPAPGLEVCALVRLEDCFAPPEPVGRALNEVAARLRGVGRATHRVGVEAHQAAAALHQFNQANRPKRRRGRRLHPLLELPTPAHEEPLAVVLEGRSLVALENHTPAAFRHVPPVVLPAPAPAPPPPPAPPPAPPAEDEPEARAGWLAPLVAWLRSWWPW